eukprot:TRINITY_DN8151_c0_g1_i6.p1 TRINITY_DN8151_c0_g1~~TRINITY_DN8151_c0_g1_i6.p1  ORF type:complete len:251 (-),score=38.60 TRINITY_DN8151_c0_g1_i6:1168-1920(-)
MDLREPELIDYDFTDETVVRQRNACTLYDDHFGGTVNYLYLKEETPLGPLVISITQVQVSPENTIYKALVRHCHGCHFLEFPQSACDISWWRALLSLYPPDEDLLRQVESCFVSCVRREGNDGFLLRKIKMSHDNPFGPCHDWYSSVVDDLLSQMLRVLDDKLYTIDTKIKIGLLYARQGQSEENQIFSNGSEQSGEYVEFLKFLGDRVELKNWNGFSGGLDTVRMYFLFLLHELENFQKFTGKNICEKD